MIVNAKTANIIALEIPHPKPMIMPIIIQGTQGTVDAIPDRIPNIIPKMTPITSPKIIPTIISSPGIGIKTNPNIKNAAAIIAPDITPIVTPIVTGAATPVITPITIPIITPIKIADVALTDIAVIKYNGIITILGGNNMIQLLINITKIIMANDIIIHNIKLNPVEVTIPDIIPSIIPPTIQTAHNPHDTTPIRKPTIIVITVKIIPFIPYPRNILAPIKGAIGVKIMQHIVPIQHTEITQSGTMIDIGVIAINPPQVHIAIQVPIPKLKSIITTNPTTHKIATGMEIAGDVQHNVMHRYIVGTEINIVEQQINMNQNGDKQIPVIIING